MYMYTHEHTCIEKDLKVFTEISQGGWDCMNSLCCSFDYIF